jgi:hypothetical protein
MTQILSGSALDIEAQDCNLPNRPEVELGSLRFHSGTQFAADWDIQLE